MAVSLIISFDSIKNSFFKLNAQILFLLTFARLHSVAVANTGQNKSNKLIRKIGVKTSEYFQRRRKRK